MGTLSLDKEKKLEADVEKAEKKAERKAAKEEESKKSLKVRGSGSRLPATLFLMFRRMRVAGHDRAGRA